MSDEQATAVPSLPTVETDEGSITLATLDELKGLFATKRSRLESLENQVKDAERELQDHLANAGINLTYELTAQPSSAELAAHIAEARTQLQRYRTLGAEVEHLRSESGFLKRLGDWGARHKASDELSSTRDRLHEMGVAIATTATDEDLRGVPTVRESLAQAAGRKEELSRLRSRSRRRWNCGPARSFTSPPGRRWRACSGTPGSSGLRRGSASLLVTGSAIESAPSRGSRSRPRC
jgi:hypothetical protein